MAEPSFNNCLAESISALNSAHFTAKLMALIASLVNFDCAVMIGLRVGKRPLYLFDSINTNRELLFERYLTSSFQDDPFYKMILDNEKQGVFSLREICEIGRDYPSDYAHFYLQTGWRDELSIIIEIEAKRWVVIYLGCTLTGNCFAKDDIDSLKCHFNIIQSLCQQHWKQAEFLLAESLFLPEYHPDKRRQLIDFALLTFGKGVLSQREKQITILIIQGLDTKEIALKLDISDGTVKNHRKRIYAKLRVVSLGELFQLFLNHLITQQI